MKNKKKIIALAAACGLIAAMGIGGTLAYLTDQTEAVNTFTFGDVKVTTIEEDWDPEGGEDETPNNQTPKSVQAYNDGINDALVFVKITVPVETVTRVHDDGTVETKADGSHDTKAQEIFYFELASDSINYQNNHFDTNWVNIPEVEFGYDGAGGSKEYLDLSSENTRVYTGDHRTYVFGYKTRIGKDDITTKLFEQVQIKNFVENQVAVGAKKDIVVETYSIQADNLVNEKGAIDTTGTLDHDTLLEIYQIYVTQNPEYNKNPDMDNVTPAKANGIQAPDQETSQEAVEPEQVANEE